MENLGLILMGIIGIICAAIGQRDVNRHYRTRRARRN